jgi:hypothetical protein
MFAIPINHIYETYSYNKSQRDALFLNFILVKNYMFRTDLLSIISSLNTIHILTSLADSQHNQYDNTYCCEYSIKTAGDVQ